MRRGIREMDLILIAFSDAHLASLTEADLLLYDRLLGENDHDLLAWVIGTAPPPDAFAPLVARIRQGAVRLGAVRLGAVGLGGA